MPDWSYHTLFRPLLFRMPPERARDLTLGAVGHLAQTSLGQGIIETFGHLRPPATLRQEAGGLTFPTPVGLGAGLDVHALGVEALARFGLGFIEIGPVTLEPVVASLPIRRKVAAEELWHADLLVNDGAAEIQGRLKKLRPLPVPLGIRLAFRPASSPTEATHERCQLIQQLAPWAQFWSLDTRQSIGESVWNNAWHDHLRAMLQAVRMYSPGKPLFVVVAADQPGELVQAIVEPALSLGLAGVIIAGDVGAPDGGRIQGPPAHAPGVALVHTLRQRFGPTPILIGAGGVHAPEDALRFFAAGATLVQVESGLVFAGPGLPKRINEALLYGQNRAAPPAPFPRSVRALLRPGWWWALLLGIAMIAAGLLAALIAITRVVLPYDEAFVGLGRAELRALNPRLLPFMTHDRVTLAGTMISIGVLYSGLALYGLRYAAHWAWKALLVSGTVGFGSFFLFLGFGYFDPLHALVSALLLPCFVLGLLGPHHEPPHIPVPSLRNDRTWRRGQWAQAVFVLLGAGIIGAGITIAAIGVRGVFVTQDLAYMRTTAEALHAASPRLVPLVAHDRAGFGGALVADGLAVLLAALWGFRDGARWLWWVLLFSGAAGFGATLAVHVGVAYTDALHLVPVVLGLVLFAQALVWARPFMFTQARCQKL